MAPKRRRTAAAPLTPQPRGLADELPDVLWDKVVRELFRFGRRPVVTSALNQRLRAITAHIAGEAIGCDPEQAQLFNVLTNPKGGSIMCVVRDAVHLSEAKVKAYAHHQARRHAGGHYNVFAEREIRKMIDDNGGYDALETRRTKKIASRAKRRQSTHDRFQTRTAELDSALGELGLERRLDSTLCDDFLSGRTTLTAPEVAEVMAKMTFYHEHCPEFQRDVEDAEAEVEAEVERIAAQERSYNFDGSGYSGFFPGIRACATKEVLGRPFSEFKEDCMARYPLPATWPWL